MNARISAADVRPSDFKDEWPHALAEMYATENRVLEAQKCVLKQAGEIAVKLESTAKSVAGLEDRINCLVEAQTSRAKQAVNATAISVCKERLDDHIDAVRRSANGVATEIKRDIAVQAEIAVGIAIDRVIEAKRAEIAETVAQAAATASQCAPVLPAGWRLTPWVYLGILVAGILIGKIT